MNYYCFHIGDYSSHTRHLTLIEDLAYRRMLDLYYVMEKPLPLDPEKVARLIGMRDHMQEVSDVLSDFFLKSEAGHTNKRCDAEISQYQAKAERAKSANKSRWAPKKSDPPLKSDMTSDMTSDADRIPTNNQEPITNNQEKPKPTPPGDAAASPSPRTAAKASRGSRLPEDWTLPKEWAMWAMQQRPGMTLQEARSIADEFKDYWISVPGLRGVKLDWFATWRNKIRKLRQPPASKPFNALAFVSRNLKVPIDEIRID